MNYQLDKSSYSSVNADINSDLQCLINYGVKSLYHMTHSDNVLPILQSKCLQSRSGMFGDNKSFKDISDGRVQSLRANRKLSKGSYLHDYVPLYFNPRNPMLYKLSNCVHKIVILEIDAKVILSNKYFISDRNAACNNAQFFNTLTMGLANIDWNLLSAKYWTVQGDPFASKRNGSKMCAEVLIKNKVPLKFIKKFHLASTPRKMHKLDDKYFVFNSPLFF